MEELKPKRKTFTSSAVKKRYNDKTYNAYALKFRKVEDADIINFFETSKANGITPAEAVRQLIRNK